MFKKQNCLQEDLFMILHIAYCVLRIAYCVWRMAFGDYSSVIGLCASWLFINATRAA